jgi:hypothetical protein
MTAEQKMEVAETEKQKKIENAVAEREQREKAKADGEKAKAAEKVEKKPNVVDIFDDFM